MEEGGVHLGNGHLVTQLAARLSRHAQQSVPKAGLIALKRSQRLGELLLL